MSYRDALAVQLEHILKQHPDSDKLTFIAERRDWLEIVDALRGEPKPHDTGQDLATLWTRRQPK